MTNANASADQPVSALRAARRRARLTMEQLSVQAGISRATLYVAEKAPHLMSVRTANAVAKVLCVDPAELRP